MFIFSFTAILTTVLASIANILGKDKKKANFIFCILSISVIVLVSGLRNGIGDTGYYKHSYALIGPGYDIMNSGYEPGFSLMLKILKSISADPQIMIFTTALITNVINIFIIRMYSEDWFELSVFLYITTYFMVTMNGIRQSLAASFIFGATPLIIKRKPIMYCLLMIFLLNFHESTFIMIPLYYICTRKAWSKEIWITIGLFVIGIFFYGPVTNILFSVLGDSKYAGYAELQEGGANILRIIIYFIPVLLSYLGRERLKIWNNSDVFINMTLVNFIIMAFSYSNWIFARFTIYTQLYVVISLPFLVKKCFYKKEGRILCYGVFVFYFLFYILEIKVGNIVYTSDYSILNLFY